MCESFLHSNSDDTDDTCSLTGTITSSSPTAQPAEVLLQATPPHRRARSAAWSYIFLPEEAWCDLIIHLPAAVLLKELHIQPHLASLASELHPVHSQKSSCGGIEVSFLAFFRPEVLPITLDETHLAFLCVLLRPPLVNNKHARLRSRWRSVLTGSTCCRSPRRSSPAA